MSTMNPMIIASPIASAAGDPLLVWREEFPILAHTTYMISHSLGPMPRRAETALKEFTDTWATRGIRAWEEGWWEMPLTCGDLIGPKGPGRHASERFDLPDYCDVVLRLEWAAQQAGH
jgi:kynureninase